MEVLETLLGTKHVIEVSQTWNVPNKASLESFGLENNNFHIWDGIGVNPIRPVPPMGQDCRTSRFFFFQPNIN